MSASQQPTCISDELLDQLIGDRDPQGLFHTGDLFDELKRRFAERMLDAEVAHHLAQPDEVAAGNTRNDHNHKTVLTSTSAMLIDNPRDRRGTFGRS